MRIPDPVPAIILIKGLMAIIIQSVAIFGRSELAPGSIDLGVRKSVENLWN